MDDGVNSSILRGLQTRSGISETTPGTEMASDILSMACTDYGRLYSQYTSARTGVQAQAMQSA